MLYPISPPNNGVESLKFGITEQGVISSIKYNSFNFRQYFPK